MGRAARVWSILAVAVLLLASAGPAYDSAPAALAAPATASDQPARAGDDHPAAAKAEKKKNKKKKKNRNTGNKNRSGRNVKDRGGKKNPPKSTPSPTPAPTPVPTPAPDPQQCQRLAVPAYFDQQADWDRMTADAPATGLIVLNPESGPDVRYNPTWDTRTKAAQAAGITVVGYVRTGLAKRDKDVVRSEIQTYFDWYGVDGIFLDETSSDPAVLPYYREMADFAHAVKPGAKVVVNPGWSPDEEMMGFVDIVVTFEHDYQSYGKQSFPAWTKRYSADRFMHIVYAVPADSAHDTLGLARERNAGYVYLTDVADPNRVFKSLGGSLWNEQVRAACG